MRFTEPVRAALDGVQEGAEEFVGTEHLLIALARPPGVASTALVAVGLTGARLEAAIPRGAGGGTSMIPFSPGAKQAIELAADEAIAHGGKDIGTAHLLLGLMSASSNAATKAVENARIDRTHVRRTVEELLAAGAADTAR